MVLAALRLLLFFSFLSCVLVSTCSPVWASYLLLSLLSRRAYLLPYVWVVFCRSAYALCLCVSFVRSRSCSRVLPYCVLCLCVLAPLPAGFLPCCVVWLFPFPFGVLFFCYCVLLLPSLPLRVFSCPFLCRCLLSYVSIVLASGFMYCFSCASVYENVLWWCVLFGPRAQAVLVLACLVGGGC